MKLSDKRHMTGQIDEPLKLKSQEVLEGQVGIRIYIETDLGFSSGDKLVVKLLAPVTVVAGNLR